MEEREEREERGGEMHLNNVLRGCDRGPTCRWIPSSPPVPSDGNGGHTRVVYKNALEKRRKKNENGRM